VSPSAAWSEASPAGVSGDEAALPPRSYTPPHLAEKIAASRAALEGERKHVTMLFADVVGSTELIQDRDPEEAQQLLDGVVQVMMDAVHRYEGTVSRLMGDGLMAMFGAPVAHEDHAVRACYAALAMQEAMRQQLPELRRTYGVEAEIRVGLNSGEVVVRLVRDDLHMDYTAMGQTVHLASRMEQLATGGSVRLSAETLALVEGYVQVRTLGLVPIKGLPGPVEIFELLGTGQARTRLQASAARGLTRFVGRQAEMEALYGALERAGAGHGQVAALVGEPGVGKSRLVWELTHSHRIQRSTSDPTSPSWLMLESGSVSYSKATAYRPVIDLLRAYCRIESRDDERTIREKVTGKLLTLDEGLRPALPALLALLDVPPADDAWETLDPAQRRRQTLDAVRRLLLRESREQPLLLVFEDLHWIDSETQALLDGLVDSLPTARILLVVNFRPEYTHSWGNKGYYTQLRIDPLGQESAEELLAGLLGNDPSLDALNALLVERTEGNPFFLEECVRSLVETGALVGERGAYRLVHDLPSVRVPATVQAILAARIDRLPAEEKRLLQIAAVIGKDVPDALLRAVADRGEDELRRGLTALQAAEFLYEASLFPELEYTFKHALTHEVAYGGLLQERRKTLHGRVLEAIERLYPDRLDEHVERLAYHALRADVWEKAVAYARAAGQRAASRSAYREALSWFEQAITAIVHAPEDRPTREQAVDLRLDLQQVLIPLADFKRIRTCLDEALTIAQRLGDRSRLGRIAFAMTHCLWQLGEHERALTAAQDALTHADAVSDSSLEVATTYLTTHVYRDLGEYRRAVSGLRRTVDVLAGPLVRERFGLAGYPAVMSRALLSSCLADLGRFPEAIENAQIAIRVATPLNHPYSLSIAHQSLGGTLLQRGSLRDAATSMERALAICEQWSLSHNIPSLTARLGHARLLSGQVEGALPLMEQAKALVTADTGTPNTSRIVVSLAEDYLLIGHVSEAAQLAGRALDFAVTCRDRGQQAWSMRLLGEIAVRETQPDLNEAEVRYREALALAEELGMRPLQAHCHLGLGKLCRRVERIEEAQQELAIAVAMLREMGMTFWLPEAEAELTDVSDRP
jgi:class 3 adenylate cyclase/tetratricopeptide (TPR) repeat protein